MIKSLLPFLFGCSVALGLQAQELLTPLQCRPVSRDSMSARKQAVSLRLPFFDDFSNYQGCPDDTRWRPSGARVNRDYDALPPTLGMVTLDALNERGVLYSHASTSLFAADTLQSWDIRLDSVWDVSPHPSRLSDSVCLSFYYLPGGGEGPEWQHVGSRPGTQDSLILEFWNANDSRWSRVWTTSGACVDSLVAATGHRWQRVAVMIDDVGFLSSAFSFRFRNLCSLADNPQHGMVGNTDQWHIDYVVLDAHRSVNDSVMHDVAFVSAPPSMLRDYMAMPARQYSDDALADSIAVVISNRYSSTIAIRYQYEVFDESGLSICTYDGGFSNIVPFLPSESYQTASAHATPPVVFSFPISGSPRTFYVRHTVHEGVGGDEWGENDTMTFVQRFADYYAYDDGMPEKGYGVVSTGVSRIASRFDLSVPDTLTVVSVFFNDSYNRDNAFIQFRLAVWEDDGGKPGRIVYCDDNVRYADAEHLGCFQRFVLESPVVVSGTIYVGLVQQSSGYLNLGFDCNHDRHDRCFYSMANVWQTTVYHGSLMLRPYFGSGAVVGIAAEPERMSLTLWPNPVQRLLHVESVDGDMSGGLLMVYDMTGRCKFFKKVEPSANEVVIATDAWPKGCYLLVVRDVFGNVLTSRRFVVGGR